MTHAQTPPPSGDGARQPDHYGLPIYRPQRLVLRRGQGSRVWDAENREYVDFAAGIAVSALGHGDRELVDALVAQAGQLWHTSNVFTSEPSLRLAQELVESTPFVRRVYLCNSGTEANEAAIKLVRKWAAAQGRPPQRRVVLSFAGSFHGRTLAAVTATAQPKYHEGYEPLPGGFRYCAFNDLDAVDAAIADGDVAGIIAEPIQGEGGVLPMAPGFLAGLRERCDRIGALLVLDEIQTGMGRTGRLWAHQWDDVTTDIVTSAKALGAGFPIGAMLVGEKAAETMQFGSHGTTFGGNPLASAVGRVALRRLQQPALLANVARQSSALRAGLARIDDDMRVFDEVRGRGLMLGAVLAPSLRGRAGDLVELAVQHGLLVLQAGPDVVRIVPALTIDDADVAAGLSRLRAALVALRDSTAPARASA
jgi:acetylornithine/N-succinyldiaminopimelate aminotransferase